MLLEVATGARTYGWQSVVGVPENSWIAGALAHRDLPSAFLRTAGAFDVRYLAELVALVRRHRIRLIHAHLITPSLYGALAGRMCGVPAIATIHGESEVEAESGWRKAKLRLIDRACFRTVFVSEYLRQRVLAGGGFRLEHTEVVHNGVQLADFARAPDRSLRRAWGIHDDEILVGAVGNVRPTKGYEVLLRAARRLADTRPNFRFIIAGEAGGPLGAELRRMLHDLALEGIVQFVGFQEDIAAVLANLDLFALPSHTEGFSLATVQAMAAGVPIVATRSGGPEEVLGEGSALLVAPGSPADLAAALNQLSLDAGLRSDLIHRARTRAHSQFSLERMIGDYDSLYRRALNDLRQPPPADS